MQLPDAILLQVETQKSMLSCPSRTSNTYSVNMADASFLIGNGEQGRGENGLEQSICLLHIPLHEVILLVDRCSIAAKVEKSMVRATLSVENAPMMSRTQN